MSHFTMQEIYVLTVHFWLASLAHAIMYFPIDPIAVYEAQFGVNGTSDIFLDEVQCRGDETSLIECQHEGFGTHDCSPSSAAGVVCTGDC